MKVIIVIITAERVEVFFLSLDEEACFSHFIIKMYIQIGCQRFIDVQKGTFEKMVDSIVGACLLEEEHLAGQ